MITAAVVAVYVAGFIVTYRKLSVIVIDDFASSGLVQTVDRGLAAAIAMVLSLVWPALGVVYGIYRILTPVTPRERKADLDAREREIERLERELGIKHDE